MWCRCSIARQFPCILMGWYDIYLLFFFKVRSRALEHRAGTCFCPCSSFLFFLRIGPFFPGASLQHTRYVHPEHCQECGPCIEELDFSLCSWKSCGKFRISNDAFTKNSCFETVLILKCVKHWNRPFPFHSISTRLIYGFLCIPAKKLKSHGSAMAWVKQLQPARCRGSRGILPQLGV